MALTPEESSQNTCDLGEIRKYISPFTMVVLGKQILKHKKIKKTHITRIILHNCILYNGDLTYIETFPVNLRIALIFTDFPTESGSSASAVQKICKYQSHP